VRVITTIICLALLQACQSSNPKYVQPIGGWCTVEYTVLKTGYVKDVKVIESYPGTYFDEACIKNASQNKHSPFLVNGQPIEKEGVRYKITYERD